MGLKCINLILLMALGAAIGISACGVKSAPVPPSEATPARIEDLRADTAPDGIRLTWGRPTEYEGGHSMHDLSGFVILRGHPGTPMQPLIEIPVTDRERFRKQRKFEYVDAETKLGGIYTYEVASETTAGYRSMPSNEVEFTRAKLRPPPNPANFNLPTPGPLPTTLP
ncbi:MAG: hypothetical protein ACREQ4_13840 [Candidatus Binataceae bacterium]